MSARSSLDDGRTGHGTAPGDQDVHGVRRAVVARLRSPEGSMTILTTGALVVILMVIAVGASITGVHLERNRLQHAADGAALAASQAIDPSGLYGSGSGAVPSQGAARTAAVEHLATYPIDTTRTDTLEVGDVRVDADGTVHVQLTATTHPPLAGWFTRGTGIAVTLTVEGEARSR
ncbi:pilus assembly protein TadG-related protein [Brachybacterium muris]|uniref:pilus assembly protein TadG-related protein n=1 Tax=Brachybacterium muris TaxID=219301 RepID=UPI0021A90F52|nr:pilus assembly protein TadG-related protein [Brachybacterium muris]MCT1996665.1 pilus assembly protein TadG-related protein [Brachybacterium muris]